METEEEYSKRDDVARWLEKMEDHWAPTVSSRGDWRTEVRAVTSMVPKPNRKRVKSWHPNYRGQSTIYLIVTLGKWDQAGRRRGRAFELQKTSGPRLKPCLFSGLWCQHRTSPWSASGFSVITSYWMRQWESEDTQFCCLSRKCSTSQLYSGRETQCPPSIKSEHWIWCDLLKKALE